MSISRFRGRYAPTLVTVATVVTGMTFTLLWGRVFHGFFHGFWVTPGDIWATYRTAHWIGWGAYGSMYSATGEYLTTPGIAIVLTPVAILTRALGLSEVYPYLIPHPTAWLILGPVEMALGCVSLFAFDSLAERLGASAARRRILCVVEGIALWPLTVLWGHPEDAVALGFAVYAIVFALDGSWVKVGWLLGAAIAFQPLVILVVPVILGRATSKGFWKIAWRALTPSAVLLILPVVSDLHDTFRAIVEQPFAISEARVTPWTVLAPHLGEGVVSPGPMRIVAIGICCAIGVRCSRKASGDPAFVWCAAICLGTRFVTESTLEPYYIWPALALLAVCAVDRSQMRFLASCACVIAVVVYTDMHFGTWWVWWGVAVLGLAVATFVSGSYPSDNPVQAPVKSELAW